MWLQDKSVYGNTIEKHVAVLILKPHAVFLLLQNKNLETKVIFVVSILQENEHDIL
jgi:hypothetical protein